MANGDEKFNVGGVKSKMGVIEGYFSDFATTLSDINAFVQTNVNASLESAAFGDLGGRLLNIWDYNASTFNDFHENFDNWAQVVAIIAANNNQFAVDALATYRDNAGTLDGVKEAREYVAANNGVSNSGSNYGTLSNAAKSIIDSSIAQGSHIPDVANIFGGKTVKKDDGTIEYYDADGNLVSYYKDGKYYDKDGNEIGDSDAYRKWLEDNGYQKPKTSTSDDIVLAETNNFGGKTIQKPDGTIEFYDADGNLISSYKGGKYYDKDGTEIGGYPEYRKWLEDNNYSTDDVIIEENNNFGGDTVTKPDGTIEYRDKDGNVMATYKDGKYYDAEGNEIGNAAKYREWLEENGYQAPAEGELPGDEKHDSSDPVTGEGQSDSISGVDEGATKERHEFSNGSYRDTYTNPDGSTVVVDYDADGNIKFQRNTDQNGVVTETNFYDENGNLKEKYEFTVEDLGDGVYKSTPKHYVLDDNGNLVKDPNYNAAPTYEWNDENGVHHVTSDPNSVPSGEAEQPSGGSDSAYADTVREMAASGNHRDEWERETTDQNAWDHSKTYKYGDLSIVTYGENDDVVAYIKTGDDGNVHWYDSDYNEVSYDQFEQLLKSVNGVE